MRNNRTHILLYKLCIPTTAALILNAQPSFAAETIDIRQPLNSKAFVPVAPYESAFRLYTKQSEVPMKSWPEANKTVAEIGGWKVYLKEAQAPDVPAAQPGLPVTPTKPSEPSASPTTHKHHQGSK